MDNLLNFGNVCSGLKQIFKFVLKQVFDGKTDNEHMMRNFCGSVAESLTR